MMVPLNDSDYARVERERRFLPPHIPGQLPASTRRVRIEDRYIVGTRLRLRRLTGDDGQVELKLGLKELISPADNSHAWMTNLYLTDQEFDTFAKLSAHTLRKTRLRMALQEGTRVSIDVYSGSLDGLVVIEADFTSDEGLIDFTAPSWFGREVTSDIRFTGGWLAEHQQIPG